MRNQTSYRLNKLRSILPFRPVVWPVPSLRRSYHPPHAHGDKEGNHDQAAADTLCLPVYHFRWTIFQIGLVSGHGLILVSVSVGTPGLNRAIAEASATSFHCGPR